MGILTAATSAPYFSLTGAAWMPCVVWWDPETEVFGRVEGPDGFTTWKEAEEASRFLRVSPTTAEIDARAG